VAVAGVLMLVIVAIDTDNNNNIFVPHMQHHLPVQCQ
jgi:hypothetical protein